jgi:F-box and leucine-rich repeat protein 7
LKDTIPRVDAPSHVARYINQKNWDKQRLKMRRHHGRGQNSPFAHRTAAPLSEAVSLIRNFDSDINPSRPVRQSPLATSQIQGMPLDLIERIRSFPLFQSTPDSFLAEVGMHLRPQMHSPNDYILTEGEDAKSMYWLVRGAVAVTSRDGESTYAELKPGAFFGEIGILMDRPRTATVIARSRCLLVVLKKEDLRKILPKYREVEQAIRDEALERLAILEKKKKQVRPEGFPIASTTRRGSKRTRDVISDELDTSDDHENGVNGTSKKRKSPSPGPNEISTSSALGNGLVNVRSLLKELPLFTSLPPELLHFLGINALPRTFPPFTDIIKQDSKGREIFFIVKGEVEVLDEKVFETPGSRKSSERGGYKRPPNVKARLKEGHYFGEVVSLSLAPRRTATVRSVTAVECLMLTAEVLAAFWEKCPEGVRQQIEDTARKRLKTASDNDVIMDDVDSAPAINQLAIAEQQVVTPKKQPPPKVTFNDAELGSPHRYVKSDEQPALRPSDPDPFLNVGLDKVKSRSRRGSLAPISPDDITPDGRHKSTSPKSSRPATPSPLDPKSTPPFADPFSKLRSSTSTPRSSGPRARGSLPDKVLVNIFKHMELHELFRLRIVSIHWSETLTRSPDLFHYLDLTPYNRKLTDEVLSKYVCPFVGDRPRVINISNCFHVTDEGFNILASTCGTNVTTWKMKSVWDVTAPAILDMANIAKGLQEVDLSNCRKVSDTLLARIVGWIVPSTPSAHHSNGRPALNIRLSSQSPSHPSAGTAIGCPSLKRLTLSYCKHVTDRTMHHIATHAATRIEHMDLTRCTTITDTGFQYWGNAHFSRLKKLCLADCTYLTDNAIIYLTNAAKGLQELDLVSRASLLNVSVY